MKKLLFILLGTFTLQFTQAQTPNDNIGSGNCLNFNGTTDVVNVPPSNVFDFGTNPFTIEAWVNVGGGSGTTRIIANKYDAGGTDTGWRLLIRNDSRAGMYIGALSAISTNVVSAGWHHLAGIRTAAFLTLYIDGVQVAQVAAGGNATANSNPQMSIGDTNQVGASPGHFNGQIDEVRIWNIARTQVQIQNNMCKTLVGNETGLVGYWNMNEGTGNTVTDLTSNGNDGTLQ